MVWDIPLTRALLAIGLLGVPAAGGDGFACQPDSMQEGGSVILHHHQDGQVTESTLEDTEAACSLEKIEHLFSGAEGPVRLLVTGNVVQDATTRGEWLEFQFPGPRTLAQADGSDITIDRVLVPVRHPVYARAGATGNLVLFFGNGEWNTGPLAHPHGQSLVPGLMACLGGSSAEE